LVNNASTDNTIDFSKEVWQKLNSPFPLKIINENRPGKGYAVETGYDAAQYSYILTVDDDNWLQSDYLIEAAKLFQVDAKIGILQGHSTGVFEEEPPAWLKEVEQFFIIGSPVKESGYFPKDSFYVWGAGMVIKKTDWVYLRSLGFTALTSKLPGKAAGEDNETAIGLLLLGRKIYYSDKLQYQHFMPTDRISWSKLKQNIETTGYVAYYFFLYAFFLDSYSKGNPVTLKALNFKFFRHWHKLMRPFTLKQQIAYWILPRQEYYQLVLLRQYSQLKWFLKLQKESLLDINKLQTWVIPLLKQNPENFKWPYELE